MYRLVQKKGTVFLSTSLAWPAVAGCSRVETFSQLSSISFAQPCTDMQEKARARLRESRLQAPSGVHATYFSCMHVYRSGCDRREQTVRSVLNGQSVLSYHYH